VLPQLIVVTGAPGAGKTTLARLLATELELPLLTKDDVKEALFDALGTGDREWSRRLGGATYEVLFVVAERLLETGTSCILESNFTKVEPFRMLPPARTIQIVCVAPSELIVERYSTRSRHPGHLDDVILEELHARLHNGEWAPLDLECELVEVDTSAPVDIRTLAARISRAAAT
jgi:predicted kinase